MIRWKEMNPHFEYIYYNNIIIWNVFQITLHIYIYYNDIIIWNVFK